MRFYIKLDKARLRMAGYWKFKTFLLNLKDFQEQGNKWAGDTLKTPLGLFPPIAADDLDRLVAQKVLESREDGAVKSEDSYK